jgi:hypothetical protein
VSPFFLPILALAPVIFECLAELINAEYTSLGDAGMVAVCLMVDVFIGVSFEFSVSVGAELEVLRFQFGQW